MTSKKQKFEPPYIGIEVVDGIPVLYNRKGDYSVIIKCENPVLQYAADLDAYYEFHNLFSNLTKILGANYTIQKQDIFCKRNYKSRNVHDDYLSTRYFEHFDGRIYTDVSTYLIITGHLPKSTFFSYDKKAFDTFIRNILKILDLFENKSLKASVLSEKQVEAYIKRFFSMNFSKKVVGLQNIKVREEDLLIGKKTVQNISLVDIDAVDFPQQIKPYKEVNIGMKFPVDLLSFIQETPSVDTILYNQVITIPEQRNESNKLESKRKRHSSMPDPANELCVEDITRVQNDIAREGQLLVYAHYNIIVCGQGDLSKAVNFIEGSLFDSGICISKQCYNQLELFECAMPGNAVNLKEYDRFLTTSDAAICLLYKERMPVTEDSPFLTYFTDRQGLPIGIDLSGKEGEVRFTDNSNKFVLGPSGSGKSFFVNSAVRQYTLQNTDIILVDTGHSYSGLCDYYGGKYITYTEEKPITMNPFKVKIEEYNEEKRSFLKSLIALLWKGADGEINQEEDTLLSNVITAYYDAFFDEANQRITSLSFNTFYEFGDEEIKRIIEKDKISFNINSFQFILKKFYKGGEYEKILNDDFDSSLFDEPFIVFEIDAIKEHKLLFPIVTLIIMDVFIQKMRLKKNRKALIIEEAWKAIASPLMANYIVYLFKTVRKFWGEVMVVTQELGDIIGNPVVKDSIISNSDIICLLDQKKFKDNYDAISALLSLNEVEKRKIFTINQLNNKENRSRFNETYIKRGSYGSVYGVEVSKHEYFTFTTERIEKDAVAYYKEIYGDYQTALDNFILDLDNSGVKQSEWIRRVTTVFGKHSHHELKNLSERSDLKGYIKEKFAIAN